MTEEVVDRIAGALEPGVPQRTGFGAGAGALGRDLALAGEVLLLGEPPFPLPGFAFVAKFPGRLAGLVPGQEDSGLATERERLVLDLEVLQPLRPTDTGVQLIEASGVIGGLRRQLLYHPVEPGEVREQEAGVEAAAGARQLAAIPDLLFDAFGGLVGEQSDVVLARPHRRRRPATREQRVAPPEAIGRVARHADVGEGGADIAAGGEAIEEARAKWFFVPPGTERIVARTHEKARRSGGRAPGRSERRCVRSVNAAARGRSAGSGWPATASRSKPGSGSEPWRAQWFPPSNRCPRSASGRRPDW